VQLLFAVLIGGVVGAAWSDGFGALIGAALGGLLVRSLQQGRLIAGLQQAVKDLQALRGAAADRSAPQRAAAEPTPESPVGTADERPAAIRPLPASVVSAAVPPPPVPAAAATPVVVPAAQARGAAQPPAAQANTGRKAVLPPPASPLQDPLAPIKRWLFGGNTIVKLGVGILFIGLAFLAKFASERVQVPVELRLAAIAAVAVALLVVGWRLRQRRSGYAQVLQGGGVAVLYLTLFVAFRFYGVLSALPVFTLMVLVAALAAALAVLQNARALAAVGALGGFATPLLVSTGSGNHVALFSYYLVLDLGIAAVAWRRTWQSLNLIGFLGTFGVATAWGALRYHSEHYASCQAFLIAFFVLFVAIMLMPARQRRGGDAASSPDWPAQRWVNGSLLFGLPTITFVLQYGLVRHTEYGVALSALALAAFYVVLARWLRSSPRLAVAFEGSLAVGAVFLTLVIPFALDARSTAGAWALEGAGLVWLGFRQRRGSARAFGYALLALAGTTLVFAHQRHGAPTEVFNALFFNGVLTAAAALAAALFVQRAASREPREGTTPWLASGEVGAEPLLIAWGTLWLLVAAAVQIDAFVIDRYALATWLAVFSGIALLYTLLSVRLHWPRVGLPAMAHAPLHAMGVAVLAVTLEAPMGHGGAWAWPLALLAHGVVLRWLSLHWNAKVRHAVHALGALVLTGLGALQGRAITADWGDAFSAWPWLGWLVVPAALLMVLQRPFGVRRWPMNVAPLAYQRDAAFVMTAGLLVWVLLANLTSNGSAQPLPHVPLLNPLDIGTGIALLASWQWLRGEAAQPWVALRPRLPAALLAGLGFVWLNAMLVRAFHHYGGVPYRLDAWLRSLAVQTGITLLWTVISLGVMWWSARRALRGPWLVGATLLGAVVLKLLLIDQSGTGTVTRIVSFIGVGVLMLVIGYVAPLPARQEDRHATS